MDNWRPAAQAEAGMEGGGGDWRNQLQQDSRSRIVNKIMETLKKHLPITGPEGLVELQKIAIRFEEKIYSAATSQSDYLRKISLKMLTMETKSQSNNGPNSLQPSAAIGNQNPSDSGSLGMQAQVLNQGQQIPLPNQSQPRQQMLPQNPITSAGIQSSGGLASSLPSVNGLSQTSVSNAVGQSSGLQNISGIPQNSVGNSVGQGVPSNIFNSTQRPMPGRQHPQQVATQQNQQQPSTASQYVYHQQQLQQQMLKQKLQQQGNMSQSVMQSHIQQQQNPLQPSQLQSSQQSLMQMASNLHSNQPSIQQTQPSMMQSNVRPGLQQNQQSSQQPSSSIPQQHPQSILRQQQQSQQSLHQQTSVLHQQQTPMPQTLMGQQPNATNMQQNHLISQQNNVSDMQQQQRLLSQQNNMSNMQQHQQQQLLGQQNVTNLHQQQLGPQNTVPGMQQQQPLVGTQSAVSSMQPHQSSMHILQQGKVVGQQQSAQASTTLLQIQGQQSQSQSLPLQQQQQQQQQLMSQLQSQPQMGLQQQQNQLQRDMQQRLQVAGSTLQAQGVIEQKPFQQQRAVPDASSTSMDSTGQTGNANSMDWQEEIYQKVKSLKELYLPELNELHQKISLKMQQHESTSQGARDQMDKFKIMDQVEKLKVMKVMLDRSMAFLQVSKNSMPHSYRDKLGQYEKQIMSFINMNRPKRSFQQGQQQIHPLSGHPLSLQQQQLQQQQPQLQQQQPQQQQLPSQTPQLQHHDNQMNSQIQPSSLQSGVTSMQPTSVTSMQSSMPPLPTQTGISTAQANMMNAIQTGSTLESGQGSGPNSLQQNGVGSLQQNSANAPQQANITTNTLSQGVGNALQSNINSLPLNPNVLQHQNLRQKQEQHMLQAQQSKQQQFHHHQMQQQLLQQQKQQMLQQQQQHPQLQQQFQQQLAQQQKQQQTAQLQSHSMPQLHQMNEDMKMRQGMSFKPGMTQQQQHSAGQRASYHHQSLKGGTQFPISPQLVQAASPQISQHASPQIDQQNLLTPFSKAGTPLQSANSPFIVPSPPTPLAPSPMPGDPEKQASGVTMIPNAGNVGQPQPTALAQAQSLAIGTPGISASPLLAEFTSPDGNQGTASTIISGKPNVSEQPMERLIKAVKSMSPKALTAAVSDIGAVISMIDRIAGSAPGNGSRAAVGEDLVAMTKCRIQARNLITQDGNSANKKMRRDTSAMPLNVVSSCGSTNDSFKQLNALETSDVESTATSGIKRPQFEVNHALLEEIREINQRLIDTVVDISDEDVDPTAAAAAAEGGEGTIVKCSFNAVALSPNLKSQYASAQMSPILPLRLLVPTNYPSSSPILLDKFPAELSKDYDDLSAKARSRFNRSLRSLSQPMSLGDMVRTWDICARAIVADYAQQSGGGSFSSRYGTWENCVSAA